MTDSSSATATKTNNAGFEAGHFEVLAKIEENSFWFVARNQLIIWALKRYLPKLESFLEIGCGTGFVLAGIHKAFPQARLSGSELFAEGLEYAAERVPFAKLFQMDATQMPFRNEFDVVGAFDVLEHIEADETVLAQIHRSLRPQGGLIVTVPQHGFLWSPSDDIAHHVRRYSRKDLVEKVERAGFKVERVTSFVSFLFPVMLVSRLWQRLKPAEHNVFAEASVSGYKKVILDAIMSVERKSIVAGADFPAGGSLLLIARKK